MSRFRPDHNGECLNCDEGAEAHGMRGECPATETEALANIERRMARAPISYVCPRCDFESFNRFDREWGYCARCHLFDDVVAEGLRLVAAGGAHQCQEWRTARNRCALCDRALPLFGEPR